jgi:hypothetical protein
MRQEHAIQNVNFTARIPSGQAVTWVSEQHTLMYPRPDSVVGTDRLPQFTVNTILNMKFNRPVGGFISITSAPFISFNGTAGALRDVPCSVVNLSPTTGKYFIAGVEYFSPPPAQFGSNPNLIKFLANVLKANLGQSVAYKVVFYNPPPKPPDPPLPLFIDVTFFGVMLSSPYLINRDYNA